MDPAEARERLADALLAPRDGGLEATLADPSATGVELRAHLAACAPCSPELEARRAIGALLATAAPDSLAAPPSLRERVMAAVGETGAPAAAPIPLRPRRRLLPLVAALAAVVGLGAGVGRGGAGGGGRARLRRGRPGGYDARHGARRQHDPRAGRDGHVRRDRARLRPAQHGHDAGRGRALASPGRPGPGAGAGGQRA